MKEPQELEEKKKTKLKKIEEEEEPTVPFLVYFKSFFLIGAIVFGMFVLNNVAQNQKREEREKINLTLNSDYLKESLSKENIQETLSEEMKTNKFYKIAVDKIEDQRDVVLGEATKAANTVVEKSKKTVLDYLYEHTVGQVMERMIKEMPEDQKEKLIEKVSESP